MYNTLYYKSWWEINNFKLKKKKKKKTLLTFSFIKEINPKNLIYVIIFFSFFL